VTGRLVAVAVDAAGAGGSRTYTYAVPAHLSDIVDGEAVIVEFGRRQALGVIVGPGMPVDGAEAKPIVDRVRADGPLLPPLSLGLARWIADHYLAPPALVIRSMLPPGLLERLELVAERRPDDPKAVSSDSDLDAVDQDLLEQLADRPVAVRSLASPDGRAGLTRRLRRLADGGAISLDWTLLGASAGPRYERWLTIEPAGRDAFATVSAGGRAPGRPLGPRQIEALQELVAAGDDGRQASGLADRHGSSASAGLVRRGLARSDVRERPRRPLAERPPGLRGGRPASAPLSERQAEAVDHIVAAVRGSDPRPLLLDGVTGGGKTAIYIEAIAEVLARGRPALVLVPEITLAMPLVDRLRADLGVRVALLHSGLGDGERADEWRRIRSSDVDIVVGTRLAAVAPLSDVGLVIVDEEHDPAYKSDRTPRLQARDVGIQLAAQAGAACVLGSATPAVDSVGRALDGRYDRVVLPTRPAGAAPTVEVVDLRSELVDGNRGMLSRSLDAAIGALDIEAGEQAILVLNRRGTASVVLCRDCGHVQACPDCERPLVYHRAGETLRCHHCGRTTPLASRCPACGSPRIRYLGGGTERVEREVKLGHPGLRVARLDRDVASRRGAADRVIDAFAAGRSDVLVGTALVAKGLDVPSVTLVGVVSSDVALNLPDERAAERTFQTLSQAVGRAGRGDRPGHAILQTYQPDHPAIVAVATDDPGPFYRTELDLRRRFGSPPYGSAIKLTVALADRTAAEEAGQALADRLRARASGTDTTIAGPAPAFIARRNDRWRFNVILRGTEPRAVLDGDPGPPWSVDVDPESLL
jgi:primosomal protein N' (replication factor Y) (superfamily II helicase)